MKTNFIKEKINNISWYLPKAVLERNSISMEYIFNQLKDIKYDLFLTNNSNPDDVISQNALSSHQSSHQKQFVPIKAGRRKIFGGMNLLGESGGDVKPQHDVYIKIFNCSSFLLKLKHLFTPSKAMREFVLSYRINECGIPAVFSIAAGDEKSMGILKRSYLIVKKINDVVNLKEFFYDAEPEPNERHVVIEKFGEIARLSHERGILQTDFALNNFLVQRLSNNGFRLYLIDYERTKICNKITDKKRIWTLAKLNRAGSDFTACDKFRFLRSYLNYVQERSKKLSAIEAQPREVQPRPEIKKWMRDIDRETMRLFKNGAWKVWKGCIKGERRFAIYRGRNLRGYLLSEYNADILIDTINDSGDFNRYKSEMEINLGDFVTIRSVTAGFSHKGRDKTIRIYKINGSNHDLHYAFWQNSNALLKGGLNVAEPIGVFVNDKTWRGAANANRNPHPKKDGYLITSHISSTQDIKDFLQGVCTGVEKRVFLRKLARFICRLHNFGRFAAAISPGDIVVNSGNNRYVLFFAHTYNFILKMSLSQEERGLDIERIARYFGDKIKDEELNLFKEMYAKNEAWYCCN